MNEIFFPYYVNRGRLLDLFSILNNGYSEYEEITSSTNFEKQKSGRGEMTISVGFKLFNIGGTASDSKSLTNSNGEQITQKKIQTIPSILKNILGIMRERNYFKQIDSAEEGDFVELESVFLKINSVKMLMDEIDETLKLFAFQKGGKTQDNKNTIKTFQEVSKTIKIMCNGEEVLYECDNFAIVGTIYDEWLYQSVRSDLINSHYQCLFQVKKKYPNGTTLMKNTLFSKTKNKSDKEAFVSAVNDICKGDSYEFDSSAVFEISNKPVYEVEIIALYK